MAGGIDFLGRLRNRLGFEASDDPFDMGFTAAPPPPIMFQGMEVPIEGISAPEVAGLTTQLPEAQPDDAGGFSAVESLFDLLDIPGAFVRGVAGAGLSALQGNPEQAGERLLSAIPGSETIAPLLGAGTGTAPTGEDLLVDLGMERGSSAEDERRVRIARAAGLDEYTARKKYGQLGDKRPPPDLLREFDALAKAAQEADPNLDLGITWDDAQGAADVGDVAGIGVEILTDPLTYLSFGATSVGKAAKALAAAEKAAPGLNALLKGAGTLEEATGILRTAKLPEKQLSRLTGLLADAWKGGKPELELGQTIGQRAERGQTALLTFGGEPVVKGEGAFKWLSTLGETDLARSLGRSEGQGNVVTEALRGFFQPIREKFSTKSGVSELDELLEARRVTEKTGATSASRELDRINQQIRKAANIKGLPESETRRLVGTLVESGQFDDETLGPLAAGIAKINDSIADKASKVPVPFAELDDELLEYIRREITPEGRKLLQSEEGRAKFKQTTGLEFSAKSSVFKGRTEAWKGKSISEINKEMGLEFFHEDPVFATRRMVNMAQKAIANAVFGEGIVKQFGEKLAAGTPPAGIKNGEEVYELLGMKLPAGQALEDLRQTRVPKEIFEFVTRASEIQKKPGKFMQFYRGMTDWMKGTVTTLFPAFHGRNLLENGFKNALEGVTPAEYRDAGQFLMGATNINAGGPGFLDSLSRSARKALQAQGKYSPELSKLFKENGIGENLEQVIDWMHAQGILENRITSELGAVLRDGPGASPARGAAQLVGGLFGTRGAPMRAGAALASGTENWHRVSLFIKRLKDGYLPAEAVNEVKRVFFDYRDLTQWESAFARNYGFFYNFYRNNLRYVTQELLSHPVRSKETLRLFERDPDNPRTRWLSAKGALDLGAADVSLGFLPQQQFNMFSLAEGDVFDKLKGKLGQAIGSMNPIISQAANLAYGQDVYSSTPLEYRTRAPDLTGAPQVVKDLLGIEEAPDGTARMGWKANFVLNSVPAVGRILQNAVEIGDKDKSYLQKLTRLIGGLGITAKDEAELGKRELALIDRNIEREGKALKYLRETGKATFAVDRSTVPGRILSALATPTPEEIPYLLQDQQIAARILPYVTVGPDGKPRMNRFLRDVIDQVFTERHPDYAALFAAQKLRSKVKIKSKEGFDLTAQESFEALFGETQ